MKKVTIKARVENARQIIDRNQYDVPFSDTDAHEFNEVLTTDYMGFVRKRNLMYPSDTRHIYKFDGVEWKDFSWRQCIQPISEVQQIKRVMRQSIAPDLRDFMDGAGECGCEICEAVEDLTVDHMDTSFDEIANIFLEKYGQPKIKEGPMGVGFMFADADVEAAWITHHASYANYQILCRSCNASKGKR